MGHEIYGEDDFLVAKGLDDDLKAISKEIPFEHREVVNEILKRLVLFCDDTEKRVDFWKEYENLRAYVPDFTLMKLMELVGFSMQDIDSVNVDDFYFDRCARNIWKIRKAVRKFCIFMYDQERYGDSIVVPNYVYSFPPVTLVKKRDEGRD